MKRPRGFLALAGLAYLLAWFLPVVDGGTTLGQGGLPGWEALRYALSPMWERGGLSWWEALISVLSALTNGWFVVSLVSFWGRPVMSERVLFWGLLLAALIDAQWFVLSGGRSDLLIGYYLWTVSFLVLAAAARRPGVSAGARNWGRGEANGGLAAMGR